MDKSKKDIPEFNPVKETINGKKVEQAIWTTNVINKALEALQQGKPLKMTPFLNNNTKLLKPELVYKRTKEEIEDYIKCKTDPIHFASKCFIMTPQGLSACHLRDYQIDYIKHLQKHRFSLLLAARQIGKSLNLMSNIFVKIDKNDINICRHVKKINYYYIIDDIYYLPIFEIYNLYCKQTFLWKIKYHLYKIIYNLTYDKKRK